MKAPTEHSHLDGIVTLVKQTPPASQSSRFGLFLARFLRNPRTVGAVAPSSSFLAAKMLTEVEWKPGVRVVEFGPGTGPFTAALFEKLPEDAKYLGIELNHSFVEVLRGRFPDADIVEDSVEKVVELCRDRDMLPLDHVISGLPFASLPLEVTERVLKATLVALRPGGTFTTFQYVHSYLLPPAVRFRREMEELFGAQEAQRIEVRNLPPAMVYSWRKPE